MKANDVKTWVKYAMNDCIVIESLIAHIPNTRERPHEQIVYHSQQAAEKMLKAFLLQHGMVGWGHNLNTLRLECEKLDADFSAKRITDHCAVLTSLNEARYPDFVATPVDSKNADRAYNSAKRIYDFISVKLGLGKHFFPDDTK